MAQNLIRLLYCDYDGDFLFSDKLRRIGYSVDEVRPEALRSISVGDHQAYVFSFEKEQNLTRALKTCEKLKSAELMTPIILVQRGSASPDFLNHQSEALRADSYVAQEESEAPLLDALEEVVGAPWPPGIEKASSSFLADKEKEYQEQIESLQEELERVKSEYERSNENLDKALQAQKKFRPKLKALFEGQKLQFQSESEQLKVRLSELEAKLLDREAKIRELEQFRKHHRQQIEALQDSHQKAQGGLREFYQKKIREMEKKLQSSSKEASKSETTDVLPVGRKPTA